MKTPEKVRETVRGYVFEHFPAAKERQITDTDSLLDSGIVDSLGVLDIVAYLETEFGMTIADDELEVEDFESIQALTAFVCRHLRCTSSN